MRGQKKQAILGGGLIGLVVATTLALPSILPPAVADEEPARTLLKSSQEIFPKRIDGDSFVKPEWTVEPWVATEVIAESTIRKIGFGRTTFVTIAETATGTYSSDGLASPYVLYPGIIEDSEAGSFTTILRYKGGHVRVTPHSSCVYMRFGKVC